MPLIPNADKMIEGLRKWRKNHPKADFALSFVPAIGTALAVDDFTQNPTALGAAGLAMTPLSKSLQMAKALRKMGITTYHGAKKGEWDILRPRPDARTGWGAVEGKGFYSTKDPIHAAAWASKAKMPFNQRSRDVWGDMAFVRRRGLNAIKKPDTVIYEADIPDKEFAKFLNLEDRAEVLSRLEKAGVDPKEVQAYYDLLKSRGLSQDYQELLPYALPSINNDRWGDATEVLNSALRSTGTPGVIRPRVDRILTYEPDLIEAIRRYKP